LDLREKNNRRVETAIVKTFISPNIIIMFKTMRMRREGNEKLVRKPEGKRPPGKPTPR
jgi:hypothetical protein